MIYKYVVTVADTGSIIVISPEIIALTIEKVKCSDRRKLLIPVGELLPQKYMEYLICVLRANQEAQRRTRNGQEVYGLAAKQIETLSINQQRCFDKVCLRKCQGNIKFDVTASEMFYMAVKQSISRFFYSYKDFDGKEVKVLVYPLPTCHSSP